MNSKSNTYILLFAASLLLTSCGNSTENHDGHNHKQGEESENYSQNDEHEEEVHLSEQQFKSLGMKIDTLPMRIVSSRVEANGVLEVPPQNEAAVTAVIGANVTSIMVIEGDKVKKGQALAFISHPELIKLQADYNRNRNQLGYLEKEYVRQKKLYEEKVGSGKEFQKVQADFNSIKSEVKACEAQLKLLGLDTENIKRGEIYNQVPVLSPINGHIRLVNVKIGQYVDPQTTMFEIVNIDHIHADLMVFEKDMHKVKQGQVVWFAVQSMPDKELKATIYAVGKSFEQQPKAIHLHAEIENKKGVLIPGMYVRGHIVTADVLSNALPEAAVVKEGNKHFIFVAKKETIQGKTVWAFKPIEVIVGDIDNGWIEIKFLQSLDTESTVAWNNAYYLLAEMKKAESEHSH